MEGEFIEFEKMSTSLSQLTIPKKLEKSEWVVLEKVHGANFSFHVTKKGENVQAARRRAVLSENENFFSHLDADFMKTSPDKMKRIYGEVEKLFPEANGSQVSVWVELFGGVYVVDGVDTNSGNFKHVQTEIQYCPHIEWIAYDISYRTVGNHDAHEYLDYDVAMKIFADHDVFYCKPLYSGAMNVALNWDLNFQSTIPKILGQVELPAGTNIAEGIVVKPLKNVKCKDGYDEEARVIVKLKSQQFQEIKDTVPPPKSSGKGNNKKQQAPKLMSKILAYATEQRLTNAVSKHGFPDGKKIEEQVIEEFVNDVFVDIKEDVELNEEYITPRKQIRRRSDRRCITKLLD